MKKILIPALLVVSAAFAPGLRNAVEFPDRTCEVAQSVVAPLFWHLWDELLNREIARLTQPLSTWRRSAGLAARIAEQHGRVHFLSCFSQACIRPRPDQGGEK